MSGKVVTGADFFANPDVAKFFNQPAPGEPQVPAAPPAPDSEVKAEAPRPSAPAMELDADLEVPVEDPKEKYLKDLAALGVTKDQAATIIDAMVFQGFYEEEVQVTKKLKVKFRTRDARAADRLNEVVNKENPQFTTFLYALIANYNLAASLVGYGPHAFDPSTDEGFEKTLRYVKSRIPLPVFQLLVTKLSQFDEKLTTIMRDGCVENFF